MLPLLWAHPQHTKYLPTYYVQVCRERSFWQFGTEDDFLDCVVLCGCPKEMDILNKAFKGILPKATE